MGKLVSEGCVAVVIALARAAAKREMEAPAASEGSPITRKAVAD
jgi:hypothetical protein